MDWPPPRSIPFTAPSWLTAPIVTATALAAAIIPFAAALTCLQLMAMHERHLEVLPLACAVAPLAAGVAVYVIWLAASARSVARALARLALLALLGVVEPVFATESYAFLTFPSHFDFEAKLLEVMILGLPAWLAATLVVAPAVALSVRYRARGALDAADRALFPSAVAAATLAALTWRWATALLEKQPLPSEAALVFLIVIAACLTAAEASLARRWSLLRWLARVRAGGVQGWRIAERESEDVAPLTLIGGSALDGTLMATSGGKRSPYRDRTHEQPVARVRR